MTIAELLTALADADIDFVIVGGLAMQMHGYGRQTYDVDVALAMNDGNLDKFVSLAAQLKLRKRGTIQFSRHTGEGRYLRPQQNQRLAPGVGPGLRRGGD